MNERKIIFECKVGSHMYGTSTENSDVDYKGVFLPSKEDLLSINGKCPQEWNLSIKSKSEDGKNTKDAVDRIIYSLPFFLHNVVKGQPWALEMLFLSNDMCETYTEEWNTIKEHMPYMLSKNIAGFFGFAKNQADRAVLKGERLNYIKQLIALLEPIPNKSSLKISGILSDTGDVIHYGDRYAKIETAITKDDYEVIKVAGRAFDLGIDLKRFHASLVDIENRYGERVKAAAVDTYDYKSLYHAYRMASEAEEFLTTGKITLPRPDANFLLKVRNKELDIDHADELIKCTDKMTILEANCSILPDKPNIEKINDLCIKLLIRYLRSEYDN